jgi:hypothetical protein
MTRTEIGVLVPRRFNALVRALNFTTAFDYNGIYSQALRG